MSQPAAITLLPNHFQIQGPPILRLMVQVIVSNKKLPANEAMEQLNTLFDEWHVNCSISSVEIPLSQLKYWDVPTQAVYAKPDLIPVQIIT